MPGEPIIVSGGSVTIEFDDKYKEEMAYASKKKFKDDGVKLARVKVNGNTVAELGERDVVTIETIETT